MQTWGGHDGLFTVNRTLLSSRATSECPKKKKERKKKSQFLSVSSRDNDHNSFVTDVIVIHTNPSPAMEDTARAILDGLPLTPFQQSVVDSIEKNPNLSIASPCPLDQASTESARKHSTQLEKSAVLHVIQSMAICSLNPQSEHHDRAKRFISGMSPEVTLSRLLTDFKSHQFIVVPETILLLQAALLKSPLHNNSDDSDDPTPRDKYISQLLRTAVDAPDYLSVLFCFPILQILHLKQVFFLKIPITKFVRS
jgi:hypothetical protein